MEMKEPASFDLLFKENHDSENSEAYLSSVRECIAVSENETEILRAIEIAFEFCVKFLSIEVLEEELFQYACPAAKQLFLNKLTLLQNIEGESDMNIEPVYFQSLNVCLGVISYFLKAFDHLNSMPKITNLQICSLLLNSAEVTYLCFQHCSVSEKIYGSNLSSLADSLKNLFKMGCDLQDQLLNFLTNKLLFEFVDEKEVKILNEMLMHLSKSGIALINLDIKSMAKVWKSYLLLVDKYSSYLENEHNVGETINYLCSAIISAVESIINSNQDNQDFDKSIRISCFLLKIVIKFCEIFNHHLKGCQNSLLNLLLTLCKCNGFQKEEVHCKKSNVQDLMNQLAVGTDPLMSQLITNEDLIKQFTKFSKDLLKNKTSPEFLILCCIIMKKLTHSNSVTRNLWFNDSNNILEWVFQCASFKKIRPSISMLSSFCSVLGQFEVCQSIKTSTFLSCENYKKFNLYEYVLITASTYLMTTSSVDFHFVERILIKSVMQPKPLTAILAIDIWCLLARFAESDLCFIQVLELSNILQLFEGESLRIDKWYIKSLIQRLIPLLTESQKQNFLKSFKPSFYMELWGGEEAVSGLNDFTTHEANYVHSSIAQLINKSLNLCEMFEGSYLESEMALKKDSIIFEELENRIINLWKFNCKALSSCTQKRRFLKLACALTSYITRDLHQENLFMILCQIKKLLFYEKEPCVELYLSWVLNSLSTVRLLTSNLQQNIITAIAEIFQLLLLSKDLVVRQKILETFYSFSHMTFHSEVIALSVQDPSISKVEISNYFQRKPSPQPKYDLNDYLGLVHKVKFQHVCYSPAQKTFTHIKACHSGNLRENLIGAQEIINRWKQDGETIIKSVEILTELQKTDIRNLSSLILSRVT